MSNKKWPSSEMVTLDYVPFNFGRYHRDFRFEVSEKFVVAWDPDSQQLNYWSRRSLSPLKMDTVPSVCDTSCVFCLLINDNFEIFDSILYYPTKVDNRLGNSFHLSGSNLVMGYHSYKLGGRVNDAHVVISFDLDSLCTEGIPRIINKVLNLTLLI